MVFTFDLKLSGDGACLIIPSVEEAFEVIEAIYSGERERLKEELGDLLFQIVFHARIGEENGTFDLKNIIDGICDKMISRHPHVFEGEAHPAEDEEALKNFWNDKKAREKKGRKAPLMEDIAVQDGPTIIQKSLFIQNYAARKGFDWSTICSVISPRDDAII